MSLSCTVFETHRDIGRKELIWTCSTSIWCPRWGDRRNFTDFLHQKTRVPGLSYGICLCDLLFSRLDTIPVCDGQTDRWMDRRTHDDSIYHASTASCSNKTRWTSMFHHRRGCLHHLDVLL